MSLTAYERSIYPAALQELILRNEQSREASARAKRIHDRYWPESSAPNPFTSDDFAGAVAQFMSVERGNYNAARRKAFHSIKARILAKIEARDEALDCGIARPAMSYCPQVMI